MAACTLPFLTSSDIHPTTGHFIHSCAALRYCLLSHDHLTMNGVIRFQKFKTWNLIIDGSFFTEMFWSMLTQVCSIRYSARCVMSERV